MAVRGLHLVEAVGLLTRKPQVCRGHRPLPRGSLAQWMAASPLTGADSGGLHASRRQCDGPCGCQGPGPESRE